MNRRDSLKILAGSLVLLHSQLFASQEVKANNSNSKKCIVGIGRGACNIIDHISEINSDFDFVKIYSEYDVLQKEKQKIHLEMQYDIKLRDKNLLEYNSTTKNQIKELVNIQSELFMIVTLGGKVGGGESQKILKYLSKQGKNVNLIAVMPFKFNGKRKNRQAIEAFQELKKYASKVYVFQNDDFATEQYKKLTVNELYPIISASIYDTIFKSISL